MLLIREARPPKMLTIRATSGMPRLVSLAKALGAWPSSASEKSIRAQE